MLMITKTKYYTFFFLQVVITKHLAVVIGILFHRVPVVLKDNIVVIMLEIVLMAAMKTNVLYCLDTLSILIK